MGVKFGVDVGLREEDLEKLEPEIAYVTSNTDIEAIALVSSEGYQIAFAAVPGYNTDSDALSGLASALLMTSKSAMTAVMNDKLNEIIVRAGDGYICIANAGRFVLVGAGRNIKSLQTTVKVFRAATSRIAANFPEQ
jgi:predicted regulator of Ras-like GTPase activity (Roadblock/LC7/MglB family)